jgi:hypothetical protein
MSAGIVAQPFAGSLVLAPAEPAPMMVLNPAARMVWEGLRAGQSRVAIATAVAAACGERWPAARRHAAALVAGWRAAGLLGRRATTPACPTPAAVAAAHPPLPRLRRVYALCGAPIAVDFAPAGLEALIAPRFDHARADGAAPVAVLALARRRGAYLLHGPEGASSHSTPEDLLGAFVRAYVDLSHPGVGWLAVLHAAALADGSGGAIVLPGPNGTGKSTLTAGLVAAGFGYLSDDCVPLAADGRVVPVPFGLCLKQPSLPVLGSSLREMGAARRGPLGRRFVPLRAVGRPLPPARIVFPRYDPKAAPALRALEPVETLTRLVQGRAWLSRRRADLAATLALLERLPAHELVYDRLSRAVSEVATLAAGPQR